VSTRLAPPGDTMRRTLAAVFLLTAFGCALPPERLPVMPLPEDGQPLPYADVVQRARLQAAAANDAFYNDRWSELEESASGLEKIARFLPKANEVPAKFQGKLDDLSTALIKEAGALRVGAQTKNVKATNEALQQINLRVREMRPE
jgi:hypothetical protein